MKARFIAIVAALGMIFTGLAAATPANATGEYEYICQQVNGTHWSLASGQPATDCHGSYLQKYINGQMVGNYSLQYYAGNGGPVPPGTQMSQACVLAAAGVAVLIINPPTGATAWVLTSLLNGAAIGACISA